ncbi:unnamed protein product [Urochloa decumbens]|uniref:Uncharacterized protein n=1 Tax=Urochloa decumbens TaxID=240449 RepID=A0ABC8V7U6_9POAL
MLRFLPAVRAGAAATSIHRLLLLYSTSTCTTSASPAAQFVVEDYLATSCGLTPEQARRASRYLPSLKSNVKPDAVRAFLSGIGISKADVAAAVSRDPRFLCFDVDKTLTPRIAQLRDLGLSPPQISRLISIVPDILFGSSRIPRLAFYLSFLGCYDKVHTAIRRSNLYLGQDLEGAVKPNIAFLQQCGLSVSEIAKLLLRVPRMFLLETERVKEIVLCADKLGLSRHSSMFKAALETIYSTSPRRVSSKLDFLKKALGCSEPEVRTAVHKFPTILALTEDNLSHTMEFLRTEVGMDTEDILRRPNMLAYSMKNRLVPRHYVLKVLKTKGLVNEDIDFYNVVRITENRFKVRFVERYLEIVPRLEVAYAAACAGQVPPEIQQ